MTKKEFFETVLKFHNYTPTLVESHREQDAGVGWIIKATSNDLNDIKSPSDYIHIEMPSFYEAAHNLFEYLYGTNLSIVYPKEFL